MTRQSVSPQEIQKWVRERHGFTPELAWIAHCKELYGIPVYVSVSRRDAERCPADKQVAIKQAFQHFGLLK
jgi:hypothetical protein